MRVKFKSIVAGPEWSAQPGQIVDVTPKEARDFVAGGYAELVDPPADERAVLDHATETATSRRKRKPEPVAGG